MPDGYLSLSATVVLQAVAGGYGYGFDIMDATGLPSGTVYPALRRMEAAGLVTSAWESAAIAHREQRPPRKVLRRHPVRTDRAGGRGGALPPRRSAPGPRRQTVNGEAVARAPASLDASPSPACSCPGRRAANGAPSGRRSCAQREAMRSRWAGHGRARRLELLRQSSGAFWDALWLRSSRWYALRLFGRHWRLAPRPPSFARRRDGRDDHRALRLQRADAAAARRSPRRARCASFTSARRRTASTPRRSRNTRAYRDRDHGVLRRRRLSVCDFERRASRPAIARSR